MSTQTTSGVSGWQTSSLVLVCRISTGSSSKLSLGALRKEAPEVSLSAEELTTTCSILCTADYCQETTQQVCMWCVCGVVCGVSGVCGVCGVWCVWYVWCGVWCVCVVCGVCLWCVRLSQ